MPKSQLLHQLFYNEPAGCFALGHVLRSVLKTSHIGQRQSAGDAGKWACDIADHDRLTWSAKVYEIFGFPVGSEVDREAAVALYSDHSRSVLERVRDFAINRQCGFILDAAIRPGGDNKWIRIIAFPVIEGGRVVGLEGYKRVLEA